jgi:site-specific recombinase XerC
MEMVRFPPGEAPDGQVRESADLAGLRDRAHQSHGLHLCARQRSDPNEGEVSDYFVQGRRGWVRLHEKGGKEHEVPCHHTLEELLEAYVAAAGLDADNPDQPLFQTAARTRRECSTRPGAGRF